MASNNGDRRIILALISQLERVELEEAPKLVCIIVANTSSIYRLEGKRRAATNEVKPPCGTGLRGRSWTHPMLQFSLLP